MAIYSPSGSGGPPARRRPNRANRRKPAQCDLGFW